MSQYKDILRSIEKAIDKFNRRIPSTQKDMLAAIEDDLRGLELSDGRIKATVKNLSLIARITKRMEKVIVSDDYKAEVKQFARAFNEVTVLQNEYWQTVEKTFKPKAILGELKKLTIADTVAKLSEGGIAVNIGDKVADILRSNITSGGSYRDLTDQLREMLTDTETPGALTKYAKQITTDSLNQYNAQYTQTTSSGLGFEWFMYTGSDITTTRPFCDAMTDQPYFHISEVPRILRAEGLTYINKKGKRVPVPIYEKTQLPHGMIPGTNADNFFVRRGGYQCGHQINPISEGLVPGDVIQRVKATAEYRRWKTSTS